MGNAVMAELSDADVFGSAAPSGPTSGELSDADVFGGSAAPPHVTALQAAVAPLTDLPSTYQGMVNDSVSQMGRGVGQIESGEPWNMVKGAGNVALGGLGYVSAPINAPLHTIVGKPVEEATGSPTAGQLAEAGASFMLPIPKGLPRGTPALPEESEFGVTLSGGEKANDLAMRQKEQAAIRSGDPHAAEWVAQRQGQLQNANEQIAQGFDPYGQTLAETPQEAGDLVSRGVQTTAAARKADVQQAYKTAQGMPGEIHGSVLQDMPQNIKTDLSTSEQPVIIDAKTSPYASQMIDFLDNQAGKLQIPNKADPFGPPPTGDIVGVNLRGIDQIRKNLSQMRSDAFGSSPPGKTSGDARAAQAVLNSFDNNIDAAVNNGMFTGDKSAISAWNNARAANADYQAAFGVRKGDPASRVVQKIIGDKVNDPLTAGKVMDQISGSAVNPSALNIGVANRLKTVLGEQSPEWVAAKQGLFRKLVQSGEGETPLGTGQVAQRLSKFLNSDMAPVMYSPQELETLRSYADLNRQITMPAGSYFPSAPPLQAAMATIRSRVGGIVGAVIGRQIVPIPLVGELAGLTIGSQTEKALERLHSGVQKQLPLVGQQMQRWSRAQSLAQAQPNPLTQRAAVAATVNLQKTLTPLGIDLKQIAMQGPGTAYGEPQQQNVPGPPPQQQNGGAVAQQRATGGRAGGGESEHEGQVEQKRKVKSTKREAHYRRGSAKAKCQICTMFRPPHVCVSVKGEIEPWGLCDYFERKPHAAS